MLENGSVASHSATTGEWDDAFDMNDWVSAEPVQSRFAKKSTVIALASVHALPAEVGEPCEGEDLKLLVE